ncbi:MAG: nucleoside triphosphate pyrophosphohydrolase [Dethiobacteria bacterium]|jgi:tetrapyrrole methylase family protein/MazG family protein
MFKLYVAGLGRGGTEALSGILDQQCFSPEPRTCIFHAAPPYFREPVEKRDFKLINIQEEIKTNPGDSLKSICEHAAEYILGILKEEGSALLILPGRPWPGEALLAELEAQKGPMEISLKIMSGEESWDFALDFLKLEMGIKFSRGVTFFDAHHLKELSDPPRGELLIAHPCSRELLSGVRRRLLYFYPPRHPVNILQFNAKGDLFLLQSEPLEHLGRDGAFNCWTYLHLTPPPYYSLGEMAGIVKQLRSPEGCPWDRQQDHFSLKSCLLEETYEVLEAINKGVPAELCEELGDLLLQVVFHSELAVEEGDFSLWQVIDGLARKIRRRHPHVFQNEKVQSVAEVKMKWQEIKQQERGGEKTDRFALPAELSALMKAQKVQKKAAEVGFDWPDVNGVVEKLYEEARELDAAQKAGDRLQIEEEIGDLFFALVNLARFLEINAEIALSLTVDKFIRRFRYIEEQVDRRGGDFAHFSLSELDGWWEEAKKLERGNPEQER